MSTSDKLTYLNTTKTKIKDAINLGDANITTETFRQYEKKIKQALINTMLDKWGIWDNFEKVTGTNTSLSLSPTSLAPISIDLKGNTYQDSTTGKNKLGLIPSSTDTINGVTISITTDGYVKINGTANNLINKNYNWGVAGAIYTSQEYTYSFKYVSGSITGDQYAYINIRSGATQSDVSNQLNPSYLSIKGTNGSKTFTPSGTGYITGIQLMAQNGIVFNNYIVKLQLETGSSATDYEPYTNGASPNPDYPQEIHNVSGDNTIEICGKNLFDKDNANILNAYIDSGTNTIVSNNANRVFYIRCLPNTTYTISKVKSATLQAAYTKELPQIGTNTYGFVTQSTTSGDYQYLTITTGSEAQYLVVRFMQTAQDTKTQSELLASTQVELGSLMTTYQSYQGQSQLISLGVENLLPTLNATKSYKDTTIDVENGIFHDTTNHTGTNEYACTFTFTNNIGYGNYGGYATPTGNIIELEAGTYTFSYKKISGTAPTYNDGSKARTLSVYKYKDTQPYTSIGSTRILGDTASITFTLNEKTKISLCYGYYFYQDVSSDVYFNLQLEKGSKANSYSPYGTTPIELNKIGNYQDYFYKTDKWYLHKEIGKYTFTGTEGWFRTNRRDGTTHFYQTTLSSINLGNTTLANELSNNFKLANPYTDNGNSFWLYKSGANEIARIGFSDETIDTADKLKTWLTNNQTITYYILATPTNTEITDNLLISQLEAIKNMNSYNGTTNISQRNNDLGFILDIKAIKEI